MSARNWEKLADAKAEKDVFVLQKKSNCVASK